MNLIKRIVILTLTVTCMEPIEAAEGGGKAVVDPMPLTVFTGLTNVVQVAAGPQHVVGIQPDGTLVFWATPAYLMNTNYKSFPSNLTNVIQVSTVWHHGIALTADGHAQTWGDPFNGPTVVPAGLSNIVAVAAGASTSHALLKNGTVVGWGDNSSNQRNSPASLTNAVAITAGSGWGAALRHNRTITAWGNNAPALGTANAASNIVTITGGNDKLLAIRDDRTVWSSADDVPAGLTNVVAIAAGYQSSLALTADGTLIKWPAAETIQGVSNIVAIGGGYRTLAVADVRPIVLTHPLGQTKYSSSTATLTAGVAGTDPISVQWQRDGIPMDGETNASLVLTNLQISATASYSLIASNAFGVAASSNALLVVIDGAPVITRHPGSRRAFIGETVRLEVGADGSTPMSFTWRFNGEDMASARDPALLLPHIQPQQEASYSVVISNAFGTVISSSAAITIRPVAMWGTFQTTFTNAVTLPPLDLTNGIALSAGNAHFLALSGDGRVFAWGFTNGGGTEVPAEATNVVWISGSSGGAGSLILTSDGSVHGWAGTTPPPSALPLVALTHAGGFRYGLTSEGQVISWGTSSGTLPWSNIVQISAGRNHLLGLQNGGQVFSSGFNTYGQVVVPSNLSNVTAVAAGGLFSMALKHDGTVVAWGDNRYGQCTPPPLLSNVVAIAGGDYTSYALKMDGTVAAWGRNNTGQTDIPEGLSNVVAIAASERQAAALIGPPELRHRLGVTMTSPNLTASSFCIDAATARARTSVLEGSQDGLLWNVKKLVAGNSLVQQVCDPLPTNSSTLYRVRSQ